MIDGEGGTSRLALHRDSRDCVVFGSYPFRRRARKRSAGLLQGEPSYYNGDCVALLFRGTGFVHSGGRYGSELSAISSQAPEIDGFYARGALGGDHHHRHFDCAVAAGGQAAREAARRMQCGNNLKQIGLPRTAFSNNTVVSRRAILGRSRSRKRQMANLWAVCPSSFRSWS